MSRVAQVDAPAKVNLFLRVFGVRPDRFHELETLFQAVDLCDRVSVERTERGVEIDVVGADVGPPEQNLAHRAATAFLAGLGAEGGARIRLSKRIPVGAGLGGGSSDAAAVLRCLAALTDTPTDEPWVRRAAAELGSDVAFFVGPSPLAAGRGRGEVLEGYTPLPPAHVVLVSPPVHVSTGWAYRALDEARRAGRAGTGPGMRGRPASWQDVVVGAHNDFQAVVAAAHPEVARSLAALGAAGAEVALMSGSGSTSFGVFASAEEAERAAAGLSTELGWPCRAARTLSALPKPSLSSL